MTSNGYERGLALLIAFTGGALIGATAALLLAPKPGKETRRRLAERLGRTKEAAARAPEALHEAFHEATVAAQHAFTSALEHAH